MNGQYAPENKETLILSAKRLSVDKDIVNALKDGDLEKIKAYLGNEGDISEFAIALGSAKDAETLDFVLKNGKIDCEQEIWAGLIARYSSDLSDAEKKVAVHKKYLSFAKVLTQNGVEPYFIDIVSPFDALQRAANKNLTKLAIYLIEECGADVNYVQRWNCQGKWYETTPLKEAGRSKKIKEILMSKQK